MCARVNKTHIAYEWAGFVGTQDCKKLFIAEFSFHFPPDAVLVGNNKSVDAFADVLNGMGVSPFAAGFSGKF